MSNNKNKIISIKNLIVKFKLGTSILTTIRNVSFDIYDGEIVAIVGESGSGKSVLTKTLTNLIDNNGFISNGSIQYIDEDKNTKDLVYFNKNLLSSKMRKAIIKNNKKIIINNNLLLNRLNNELINSVDKKEVIEIKNKIYTLNKKNDETKQEVSSIKKLSILEKICLRKTIHNVIYNKFKKINLDKEISKLNKKIFLTDLEIKLLEILNTIKDDKKISLKCIDELKQLWNWQTTPLFISSRKTKKELIKFRGNVVANIFQDPMTSLNPLLSVGKQITEVIRLHQGLSKSKAKEKAIELISRVGIQDAKNRFHDIPSKYSGGMRQRIVIAIALACKPRILVCDEPTTALDVTIQAQILELIKDLKKEYKFTVLFITHDLGVVANIADRVAVLYAGQFVEYGLLNEVFFNAKHPYTWALLCSLPQLGEKGDELYSIDGTPPSLFQPIKGDPFAPRNNYSLKIDYLYEPPLFKVSDTHYAKTWLLDARAPKVNKPKQLLNFKQVIKDAKVGE